jgi:hypothetical protein
MFSSVIADDIRKRSIRVQRDQILDQLRREEEIDNMSIPKRFILEAEERARERVNDQGWKKTFIVSLIVLVGGGLFIFFLRRFNKEQQQTPIPKMLSEMEIQTDDSPQNKKNVRFETENDGEKEEDEKGDKMSRLMEEFPNSWRNFILDYSPEGLVSDLTGSLVFDFYDEESLLLVDFDPEDFFQFPNSITNDEIRFKNMIYDKKLKRKYCEDSGIEYYEFKL